MRLGIELVIIPIQNLASTKSMVFHDGFLIESQRLNLRKRYRLFGQQRPLVVNGVA